MACRVGSLLVAVAVLQACNDDADEHPPKYMEEPATNLVSCPELIADTTLVVTDDLLFVAGEPAQCAVTGLNCPLDPTIAASFQVCDTGEDAWARCTVDQWRLLCSSAQVPAANAGAAGQSGSAGGPNSGSAGWRASAGRTP